MFVSELFTNFSVAEAFFDPQSGINAYRLILFKGSCQRLSRLQTVRPGPKSQTGIRTDNAWDESVTAQKLERGRREKNKRLV